MAVRPAPIRHRQPPNLHHPQQSATSFCIVSPAARHPGTPGAAPGLDRTFKVCLSCRSAISHRRYALWTILAQSPMAVRPAPIRHRPSPQTSITPSNQQHPSALSVRPRGTQELRALHRALIEPSRFACLADQRSAIADTHSGLSLRNHQWPSDPHPFATAPAPKPPSPPAISNILMHCQSGREAAQELLGAAPGLDRTFKVCLSCRSAISHRRYALWTILAQSPMAVRPAPIRHPPQPPNLHHPQQSATSFCIVSPAARHPGTPGAAPGLDRTFKVCLSCRSAISHRRYALWTILAQSPMAVRPAPIRHPPQPPSLHQPQQSAISFCIVSPAARQSPCRSLSTNFS